MADGPSDIESGVASDIASDAEASAYDVFPSLQASPATANAAQRRADGYHRSEVFEERERMIMYGA
jgi:hypothetical protein